MFVLCYSVLTPLRCAVRMSKSDCIWSWRSKQCVKAALTFLAKKLETFETMFYLLRKEFLFWIDERNVVFVAKKCVITKLEEKKYFYFYYILYPVILHLQCNFCLLARNYVLGNLCPRFGIDQVQYSREDTVLPIQSECIKLLGKLAELIFFLTA